MNICLDDDSIDTLLIRLLTRAGHDIQVPADVNLAGGHDAAHLRHAIEQARVILTHNRRDFV